MMYYTIEYNKRAKKFINNNHLYGLKFIKAFKELSELKFEKYNYDVKKISGYHHRYRLRIGKYRALFEKYDDRLLILVIDIDSRGDIYKSI